MNAEPKYLQVRNWEQFQNADVFRKSAGRPPWIKLYQSVLDDPELEALTHQQLGALVRVWLWAARLSNRIPASKSWWRTHLGRSGDRTCTVLVQAGFLEPYKPAKETPANGHNPSQNPRDTIASLSRQEEEVDREDLDLSLRPKGNSTPTTQVANPATKRAEALIRNLGHELTAFSVDDELVRLAVPDEDKPRLRAIAETLRSANAAQASPSNAPEENP